MSNPDLPLSAALFQVGQIRLAELSVYNWGSFNGLHTARIDPQGTLVTGDNGAGKSTFIDGLMALLLPAGKATFNVAAAQGDRTDRTLLSYMRGSFGSTHDGAGTRVRSKREAAVVTGLRAFYEGDDGSRITLAGLFWTTQSTNALADVKRVYVVAKRNLTLKEILDAFGEGNTRALKQWLRDDPAITCCDEHFAEYQELYRKLLYMENKNAPALLSRALGLKKIDDLTGLIRELVLEPSSVKEDARKVVDEFADLVAIHQKLIDARKQQEQLSRLPELDQNIKKAQQELAQLTDERNGLPVYFAEVGVRLWGERIHEYQKSLEELQRQLKDTRQAEIDANKLVERRHEEYLQFGGDKVESLKKEIGYEKDRLSRVITESSHYQQDAKNLGLAEQLVESRFLENQAWVASHLSDIERDNRESQDRFGETAAELSQLQQQQKLVGDEIREIEARPDSNIDVRFQQLRDELVQSLGLDKNQFMYIGELVDVSEEQRGWQGAIERSLGGLRTTLAVPGDCYSMVTRWLNARHTGLHVRVQVIDSAKAVAGQAVFKTNGFLRKLVWREHPYREWLKHHLARFDLQCVASTEELDETPFSMTQQGLMHLDHGRFEKKDQHRIDDRRQWYLGFSNKSRLALLNEDNKGLLQQISDVNKLVKQAREALNDITARKTLLEKFQDYRWDDINAPYWRDKVEQLQNDLQKLEQSGGDLRQAEQDWEEAKQKLSLLSQERETLVGEEAVLTEKISDAASRQKKAAVLAATGLDSATRSKLEDRIDFLTADNLDYLDVLQGKYNKQLDELLDSWRRKKDGAEKSAVGIMSAFRAHEKWQVIASDWGADIASLVEYLQHLQKLSEDGLPNLVEQFIERLNKHATQSLARIRTKLESEREDIIERIDVINQVLQRTEFKAGSYLKLGTRREKFPHVQDFEKQLVRVLSQVTSDDHEARYRQLEKVVEVLDKASNPTTSGTQESLRLLDPRYQMSFYAEELDAQTQEVRDVLESSSGKSGGEKESFAGTIVAASLAYVLTPEGYDHPVYSTVFLDEAFSNTAETVSRRVLRVFKELHIHVNLITPYKNLNLARESARSLLIAERDQDNHASHLCEVTWEEIDQKMEAQREQTLKQQADELGIHIEPLDGVYPDTGSAGLLADMDVGYAGN